MNLFDHHVLKEICKNSKYIILSIIFQKYLHLFFTSNYSIKIDEIE